MALESGTYINSLDANNPATTDGLSQADDHMRLIKSTIKATLPNMSGAVTLTHIEVNALETRMGALEGTGQYAPAIVVNTGTPALKSNITAAEVRSLLGLDVSDTPTFTTVNATTVDFGDWTITEVSGVLKFAYAGTAVVSLSSNGTITSEGNITAYGSA
jgi:hypothetical protein